MRSSKPTSLRSISLSRWIAPHLEEVDLVGPILSPWSLQSLKLSKSTPPPWRLLWPRGYRHPHQNWCEPPLVAQEDRLHPIVLMIWSRTATTPIRLTIGIGTRLKYKSSVLFFFFEFDITQSTHPILEKKNNNKWMSRIRLDICNYLSCCKGFSIWSLKHLPPRVSFFFSFLCLLKRWLLYDWKLFL